MDETKNTDDGGHRLGRTYILCKISARQIKVAQEKNSIIRCEKLLMSERLKD